MESKDKRFIHLSPTSLTDLMTCRRYFQWRNWRKPGSTEALDFGTVFHKIADFYYKAIIRKESDPINFAALALRAKYASNLDIDVTIIEKVIDKFYTYIEHYGENDLIPLESEKTYGATLFENDQICVLFEYIVDLICEYNGEVSIFDHKTTGRFQNPIALTNQFLGITWARPVKTLMPTVWMNRIGTQKNPPKEGYFDRFRFDYNSEVLAEWHHNTITWIARLLMSEESGVWDADHSACWKCIFHSICMLPPNSREVIIRQEFIERPPHDMYGGDE
jgi:hypothetical protein